LLAKSLADFRQSQANTKAFEANTKRKKKPLLNHLPQAASLAAPPAA
jgi:hypothetical protein